MSEVYRQSTQQTSGIECKHEMNKSKLRRRRLRRCCCKLAPVVVVACPSTKTSIETRQCKRMQVAHLRSIAIATIVILISSSIGPSNVVQIAEGSRRFLTGLIIGTLLARNGAQPYSPPSSYSAPSSYPQQQQPLFIIIPSGGKSGYKQPSVYPPPPYARGSDPYESFGAESQPVPDHAHRAAGRRLSPYFRRRSASLLKRKKNPASATRPPLPQPTLAQVLRPSLTAQPVSDSLINPASGSENGHQLNNGLSGLTRASSSLFLAGSGAKKITHELTAKTNDMANRIRNRHRSLWSNRGQSQANKPSLRRSRSGHDPNELLEDGSSRFMGDGEDEETPVVVSGSSGQTLSDRVSKPADVKILPSESITAAATNRWRETTSLPAGWKDDGHQSAIQNSTLIAVDETRISSPNSDSHKRKTDGREQ